MHQEGGANGLESLLSQEAEDSLPEFKKKRPKYYYYYNWMRQRVIQACGELPSVITEKLIRIDATELDMLLTYPTGIKTQVRFPHYSKFYEFVCRLPCISCAVRKQAALALPLPRIWCFFFICLEQLMSEYCKRLCMAQNNQDVKLVRCSLRCYCLSGDVASVFATCTK